MSRAQSARPRETTAPAQADLTAARRVLLTEADALHALAEALDDAFETAVARLAAVTGRVVVTGMGKSGHVAHKMASTLASTGTPALFVHPAEASHGDLGMIAPGDAVLALSNSGETPEMADIVAYTRRTGILLIGITRKQNSSLAEQADLALVLPESPEACPLGLAPTTSTTQMMALGDAIAVALLERRGFSASDFGLFHPGGALGRRLVKVEDLMHRGNDVPLAAETHLVRDAILAMMARNFGIAGIVGADGRLVGSISDGDLRRHMGDGLLDRPCAAVMAREPRTIRPGALAAEAVGEMNRHSITSLFVTQETGVPVGIVRLHDCLRAGAA